MNPQRKYPTLLSRVLLVSTFALATAACSQEVDPSDSSSPDDQVTRSSDTPGPTTPAGTDETPAGTDDTTDTTDTDDTTDATDTDDTTDATDTDDTTDATDTCDDDDNDGRDDDNDGRDDDNDGQRDC
jgi:cytoskeletal protein RodZ